MFDGTVYVCVFLVYHFSMIHVFLTKLDKMISVYDLCSNESSLTCSYFVIYVYDQINRTVAMFHKFYIIENYVFYLQFLRPLSRNWVLQ